MARYEKGELIDFLIENSEQFSEGDRTNLMTFNADQLELIAEKTALQVANSGDAEEDDSDEEEEEEEVANTQKTLSPDEVFKMLPPEHQAIMNEALEIRQNRRDTLVKAIVENKANTFTENALKDMDLKTLEGMYNLMGGKPEPSRISNYFGGGAHTTDVSNSEIDQSPLEMPVLNFEEESKKNAKVAS